MVMKVYYSPKVRIDKNGNVYKTKNINPIHEIQNLIGKINNNSGTEPTGGTSPDQDMTANSAQLNFSTSTMTGPENQRIITTAYNENGGADMFGSNTAYNEEKEQGSWWDKNGSAIINGIAGISSALITGQYNKELQHSQNKYNAAEAQKSRDFNLYMANTAHQREMEDLVAAGLNPANTATGGQGAGGESGAQASGANPAYMGYSDMANTALSLAETMKALSENKYISKEKKAQIANTTADTVKKEAETKGVEADTKRTEADTQNIKKQYELLTIEEQKQLAEMIGIWDRAKSEAEKAKVEAWINSTWVGKFAHGVGKTISQLLPILGPIGRFSKSK